MADATPTNNAPSQVAQADKTPAAPPVPEFLVQKDGAWYMKGIVDKKEVLLPVNEVQTRLQKDVASEQRFAEAAAKEQAANAAIQESAMQRKFWDLAHRGEAGDVAAAAEALRMLGKNPDDYLGTPAAAAAPQRPAELPADVREAIDVIAAAKKEGIDPLVAMRYAHNAAAGEIRNQVFETVEQTALLDSVLGPIFKDPRNKTVADVVRGDLQRHVKYLVGVESAEPGPATYARAVRDISTKVASLRGTQTQPANPAPGYPLGLGPASGGVHNETLDPAKRIKAFTPISHSMDEWAENFAARVAQGKSLQGATTAY